MSMRQESKVAVGDASRDCELRCLGCSHRAYQPLQYSAHHREEPFPMHEFSVALTLLLRSLMITAFSHVTVRPHVVLSAFDTPRSIWRSSLRNLGLHI